MQIQVNSDHNIKGGEGLTTYVNDAVENALTLFRNHITRVEVHLSDENSNKKSSVDDIRCVMEARLEGRQPIAATHQGATVNQAVDGAAEKLTRMIESILGRLHDQKIRRTDPPADQKLSEA